MVKGVYYHAHLIKIIFTFTPINTLSTKSTGERHKTNRKVRHKLETFITLS